MIFYKSVYKFYRQPGEKCSRIKTIIKTTAITLTIYPCCQESIDERQAI